MDKPGIVTFAFGTPASINSNTFLAQITELLAKEIEAPVFTQLDIQLGEDIDVQRVEEIAGQPPPTLRIAREAIKWTRQRGIKTLYVLAAKPHLWRALRDVKQVVREAEGMIEVRTREEIEQYPEDSWFCPNSTQDRTQSRKAWNKREWPLKLMPFWIYKKIAS